MPAYEVPSYFDLIADLHARLDLSVIHIEQELFIGNSPSSVNNVLITHAIYDPPGSDVQRQAGEFVVLENIGRDIADVSGWTLVDGAGHVITLPDHRYLGGGERVRVYVGQGDPTPGRFYAGRKQAVLNNRSPERLELRDRQGNIRHVMSWEES